MYNGEIIQFTGGTKDYIGELDQGEHPNGPGWWRINKPCMIFERQNPEKRSIENVVTSFSGPQKSYRKFVDIYLSPEHPIEIKVVDKNGDLYKVYRQEADRVASDIIISPNLSIVGE